MAANSISMLRQFNSTIKVKVFFFRQKDGSDSQAFFKFCEQNAVLVEEKPLIAGVFHLNRYHLTSCEEDCLLFIDSDTFIFGDIEELFSYDVDFVACRNEWVNYQGWNKEWLPDMPFNGGVMLFRNGYHRDCFESFLGENERLQDEKSDFANWLRCGRLHCRDEFAISSLVLRSGQSYGYFAPNHCWTILKEEDITAMDNSIVFHSFAAQWQQCFNRLNHVSKNNRDQRAIETIK